MSATKVKLRKRTLPSGKITLYLDFYPPVRNPKTLELSRREYLGIYLKSNPRTIQDLDEECERRASCYITLDEYDGFRIKELTDYRLHVGQCEIVNQDWIESKLRTL